MDVPVKKSRDKSQNTSTDDVILSRRLKNRERQRRYRARKRLKADTQKASGTNGLDSLQVEVPVVVAPQVSAVPVNIAPRDCAMPVNVSPQACTVPGNVATRDCAMPVNVAPQACAVPVNVASSVMAVNVSPQEHVMPVKVPPQELVMRVSSASRDCVTRLYSGRDWKRDARKAHAARQEEVNSNGSVSSDLTSTSGSQAPSVPHVHQTDVAVSNVIASPVTALENNGTPILTHSRRNWKAEARNKKG